MAEKTSDFGIFMKLREDAARAYVRGEAAALGRLLTRESPATFFGPGGGVLEGADMVSSRYAQDAKLFGPEGETSFQILHSGAGGDVAYWTGVQHATVRIAGNAEAIRMELRVTEVFRREAGEWKLIHRHADMADPSREGRQ